MENTDSDDFIEPEFTLEIVITDQNPGQVKEILSKTFVFADEVNTNDVTQNNA